MSAKEKSDLPEVAKKQSNKAASAAAETVERRGGAKENAGQQNTVRTQSREAVSRAQVRIREAVTRNRQDKLTALLHRLPLGPLPRLGQVQEPGRRRRAAGAQRELEQMIVTIRGTGIGAGAARH